MKRGEWRRWFWRVRAGGGILAGCFAGCSALCVMCSQERPAPSRHCAGHQGQHVGGEGHVRRQYGRKKRRKKKLTAQRCQIGVLFSLGPVLSHFLFSPAFYYTASLLLLSATPAPPFPHRLQRPLFSLFHEWISAKHSSRNVPFLK